MNIQYKFQNNIWIITCRLMGFELSSPRYTIEHTNHLSYQYLVHMYISLYIYTDTMSYKWLLKPNPDQLGSNPRPSWQLTSALPTELLIFCLWQDYIIYLLFRFPIAFKFYGYDQKTNIKRVPLKRIVVFLIYYFWNHKGKAIFEILNIEINIQLLWIQASG